MPLVVPGITDNSNALGSGSKEEWLSKLAGKKIGDSHDEVVSEFLDASTPCGALYGSY